MENAISNNQDKLPWQNVWCRAKQKGLKPVVMGAAELSPDIADALTAMVERHGKRDFATGSADIVDAQSCLHGRDLPKLIKSGNLEAQMFGMLLQPGSQVVIG